MSPISRRALVGSGSPAVALTVPARANLDAASRARRRLSWLLVAGLLVGLTGGIATGIHGPSPAAFWSDLHGDQAQLILWQIRAPRTLGAALVGALLGLSGALAQGLFRNPLADVISRAVIAPQELPVGVITAVLGGGYLFKLLREKTRA
jgi:iron complex transport system permease protein